MIRKRVFNLSILCMALLITSCTFTNQLLQTVLLNSGTPIPTSTNTAVVSGTTQRIQFAAGATSAQVTGQVSGNIVNTYLLAARGGQQMSAQLSSPNNSAFLTLVTPGGSPLVRAQAGARSFNGTLPATGDYVFQVSAPASTPLTTYVLSVSVTGGPTSTPTSTPQPTNPPGLTRIRFASGASSATATGPINSGATVGYLLAAGAGQRMLISLTSPGSNVYLTVTAPSGATLVQAQFGETSLDRFLSETGDYLIQVSTLNGTPQTSYTLSISINGALPPPPAGQPTAQATTPPSAQRIVFASGASSAQVSGHIVGTTIDTYLLAAQAGQFMQVSVSSPTNNAFLSVISPSGLRLANAPSGAKGFSGTLPDSGDYTFRVSTSAGTAHADYTLNVSVTGTPPPATATLQSTAHPTPTNTPAPGARRIRFAAGATSATVTGQISGGAVATYLLAATSGQRMLISLTSPGSNVYMTVTSPSGATLAQAGLGETSLDRFLSESGDYTIAVSTQPGTPQTSYSLNVSVTG